METDRKILKPYDTMLNGLADYLGEGCEIVLHSLGNLEQSVIKIVNGHHTGRRVGALIINLALEMLDKAQKNKNQTSISYFTRNKKGEPLRSATIVIRGENDRIIGLLCINLYLNTPLADFLSIFTQGNDSDVGAQAEVFLDSSHGLPENAVASARQAVSCNPSVLLSLKNRNIIRMLYNQGIFNMKNSVDYVASQLNISKNTVYMHLRYIKDEHRQGLKESKDLIQGILALSFFIKSIKKKLLNLQID